MDLTIQPHVLQGEITIIPSKSQAHRLLILASFAKGETFLRCKQTNRDIEATAQCLQSLGASITRTDDGYRIVPASVIAQKATLPCGESGSTLRFLLPVVGALGVDATFQLEGRLPQRPLSPLWEEMERMGCQLSRPTENTVRCCGKLRSGTYSIDGGVSSQFISGFLFAHWLMDDCNLRITGKLESAPYVDMTHAAIDLFPDHNSPGIIDVEGDWSNGAFFLASNTLGSNLKIRGLNEDSRQGDRAVISHLSALKNGFATIGAEDIPDLVPILAVVAGACHGGAFTGIRRLRLKESDRVASVIAMINSLGGHAAATQDTLTVDPGKYSGATVDAVGDHRIAMAAAIAATAASGPVTILGAHAVEKSYPQFWAEYARLGGKYEQHIR